MVEDNLYSVIPKINGVTLAFSSWQDGLTRQGALVFNAAGQASYRRLLKIMNVQVFICFKGREDNVPPKNSAESSIRIFSSLRNRQESLKITASLHRQCAEWKKQIACEMPGMLTYLRNWRYYRYYFAAVPTVLLEITNIRTGEEEFLREIIYQALIEYYGISLSADHVELMKKSCLLWDKEVETEVEIKEVETSCDVYKNDQAEIENRTDDRIDDGRKGLTYDGKVEDIVKKRDEKIKAIPKIGGTKKRRKKNVQSMFPPSDGPIFQFSAPSRRIVSYPTLPPLMEGDRIIPFSHQQCPICEDFHDE